MRRAIPPLWPLKNSQSERPSGLGNRLHPPGDLRLRQPEHFLFAGRAGRPDGVQRPHGGGGDGDHGALGFGVGLGAGHGDVAAAIVPALHVATVRAEASERQSSASDSTATRATSNFSRWAACSGVSKPRPRRRGWMAVRQITARTSMVRAPAWRWGLASCRPRPFKEARTSWSRPGDSWPANSWTLAMALVARRMVAMLAP